ncbi:unnamed protein product [Closterium sp. Yama58-4]|nr:unnamed protein product [Closterium sp. Yama58-4]
MHRRLLVSGLPRSLPPLPASPAPPCLPCVEGQQRAAPHSSSFPPIGAPLQTLHLDVWGPARVRGQGSERYFLLVVDDYSRYTTVFPLRTKGEVPAVLIPWIRAVRLQLRRRFRTDLPVLRLHSDRGGEFTSDLLQAFCQGEGIEQSFTLPGSPQQNGVAERRIGLVMEIARTSLIHAAAPHFLWPFAVRYAAHQLNLWPRVSLPDTSPTLRWTREVGDASRFRVWGARALVRDTSTDKLSSRTIPCVFLGFVPDAPSWQFYHPTSRRVFPSQDVTFDESVPFYRLFPYRTAPLPPPPLFLAPGPPPVDPLPPQGPAPSGVSQVDPLPLAEPLEVTSDTFGLAEGGDVAADAPAAYRRTPRLETPPGFPPRPSSPPLQPVTVDSGAAGGGATRGAASGGAEPVHEVLGGVEPGCAEPTSAEPEGAELEGAGSGGAESAGVPPGLVSRQGPLSLQQLREWLAWRTRLRHRVAGVGGPAARGTAARGVAVGAAGAARRGGAGSAGVSGSGGARTGGTGAARTGGAAGAGGAKSGGTATCGVSVRGTGAGDSGAGGAGPGGTSTGGSESAGAEPRGAESAGGPPGAASQRSPLSPQQLREWLASRTRLRSRAAGAGDATAGGAGAGGTGAGGPRAGVVDPVAGDPGAGGAGSGGAAAGGTGAGDPGAGGAGSGGAAAGGAGAGDPGAGGAGSGGAAAGGTGAGDPGAGGAGSGGAAAGGAGAGGAGVGGAGAGGSRAAGGAGATGAGGTAQPRLFFAPPSLSSLPPPDSGLRQVLSLPSSTGLLLQPGSTLPAPPPYTEQTDSLTERREPASRLASPVRTSRTSRRVPRERPPPVPGTHTMALRPSSVPQRVPLPSPPESSLPHVPDPESDLVRAAHPTVTRLLATVVTDPSFESAVASALVSELVDFAAACHLDYATSLVAESEFVCPPSVGGECALGTTVLENTQEDFECLAAAVPHLVAMLLAPEGDPDAPDIPTPRSYAEAITGPYSSQWQTAMDAEVASWKSTGTYVDEVPPPGANIVDGMWIFRVKRPPGSSPVFKARYVARGFSQ